MPFSNIPPALFSHLARKLRDELLSSRLHVELIPNRTGDAYIRVATQRNPSWYQRLCALHPSTRKRKNHAQDTKIRRANVIAALNRLIDGCACGKYEQDLKAACLHSLTEHDEW